MKKKKEHYKHLNLNLIKKTQSSSVHRTGLSNKKTENSFVMVTVEKPTFTYAYTSMQTQKETDS
jgi:hypothetical protein